MGQPSRDPRRKIGTSHRRKNYVVRFWENRSGVHAYARLPLQDREFNGPPSDAEGINSLLPPDIMIQKMEEVEESFHARRHSKSKVYEYRILNRNLRSFFIEATFGIFPRS